MEKQYHYKAFISYRHKEPDKFVATNVQNMLENFKINGKKMDWRIFRDETELPTSGDLSGDIDDALHNSEFLIVICSPILKESKWCMQEINTFKSLHNGSTENILAIVANGDPSEAFPIQLCTTVKWSIDPITNQEVMTELDVEPLAANVAAPTNKEIKKKLKTEILRLAAPLAGLRFDDLFQREKRKEARQRLIIGSALLASSLAFGIYNYNKNKQISLQLKQTQIAQAENLNLQSDIYYKNGLIRNAIESAIDSFDVNNDHQAINKDSLRILADEIGAFQSDTMIPYTRLSLDKKIKNYHFYEDSSRLLCKDESNKYYLFDTSDGNLISTYHSSYMLNEVIPNRHHIAGPIVAYFDSTGLYSYESFNGVGWSAKGYKRLKMNEDSYVEEPSFITLVDSSNIYLIDPVTGQYQTKNEEDFGFSEQGFFSSSRSFVISNNHIVIQEENYSNKEARYLHILNDEYTKIDSSIHVNDEDLSFYELKYASKQWFISSKEKDVFGYRVIDGETQEKIKLNAESEYALAYVYESDDQLYVVYRDNSLLPSFDVIQCIDSQGNTVWSNKIDMYEVKLTDMGILKKEDTNLAFDSLYFVCGNGIFIYNKETGELFNSILYEDSIIDYSYNDIGRFYVTLANGNIHTAIPVNNEIALPIVLVDQINVKLNGSAYCKEKIACSYPHSNDIDIFSRVKNTNETTIISNEMIVNKDYDVTSTYPYISKVLYHINDHYSLLLVNYANNVGAILGYDDSTNQLETIVNHNEYFNDLTYKDGLVFAYASSSYAYFDMNHPEDIVFDRMDYKTSFYPKSFELITVVDNKERHAIEVNQILDSTTYNLDLQENESLFKVFYADDSQYYVPVISTFDVETHTLDYHLYFYNKNKNQLYPIETDINYSDIKKVFNSADDKTTYFVLENGVFGFNNQNGKQVVQYQEDGKFYVHIYDDGSYTYLLNQDLTLDIYSKNNFVKSLALDYKDLLDDIGFYNSTNISKLSDQLLKVSINKKSLVIDTNELVVLYSVGYLDNQTNLIDYDANTNQLICLVSDHVVSYPLYSNDDLYQKAIELLK